ncbi:hypothetical protein IKW75_02950 [Candidatus Saccharibacteria bacterium]|nr:hypothetical protein [Candidatus Saccharibacteria bacterium]
MKKFLFRRKIRRLAGISLSVSVFLVLAAIVQPHSTSAETSSEVNLALQEVISVRILNGAGTSEINNVPLSVTADPGGSFASNNFNVDVSTSAKNGYKLYVNSNYTVPSTSAYSTDLTNLTENSYTIPTITTSVSATDFSTGASGSTNKWGISIDSTNFIPVPGHSTSTQIDSYNQSTASRLTPIVVGLFVNLDKPSGTYKNQLTFSAVANPEPTLYSLFFEPGTEATVTNLPETMTHSEISSQYEFTIPSTAPTRDGYNFSGYLDQATGITYQPGDTFTIVSDETYTGEATLVAQWGLASYTVNVSTSNVSANKTSVIVNYGGKAAIKVAPSSGFYLYRVNCPSGYTCSGYHTGEEYTGQQTIIITNNNTDAGGNLTVSGSVIETMQDSTYTTACKNAATGTEMNLSDTRTGRAYRVAKLADGKCWMTESLRLSPNRTLTSSDSDVSSDYFLKPTKNTAGDSDWCNSSTEACVNMANTGNAYGSHSTDATYGFYYTWAAATAGSGTYSTTSGAAGSSICPKGWRLPTMAEFSTLYSNYNSIAALTSSPVYISTGGYTGMYGSDTAAYIYNVDTSSVDNIYYWSSTASSASEASALITKSGVINTANPSFAKYNGAQVRCVAK